MRSLRPCLGLLAGILCAAGVAHAQVDYATATLRGMITDPAEKIVAGAKIMAINQATGATRSAVTNAEGYLIQALTPGLYRVETSAQGFARSVAKDVVLNVGQTAIYDLQLRVGFETSIIEVSADLPMSRPEETQQSNIINDLQVENLPNITRNFVQSIYTVPGVNNSFAPALQNPGVGTGYLSSGFSIGASSGRSNLVTIDGGENDYGSGTQRVAHVPIDSIQEFQINRSSFGAEFGYTVGSAINMVTRSGTNQFHGTGAGYFRNRATDSPNYFNRLADPNHEPFEQTAIFSATLGGPIRKNSLFFFTAPEYQRLDSATVQNISGRSDFQPVSAQTNGFNPATGGCPNQGTPQQQVTQLCYLTQLANSGGPLGALGSALLGSPTFGNPMSNPILKALVSPNEGTFNGIISGGAGSGERGIPGFNTPRGRYFNWVSRVDYTPAQKDTLSLRFSLMKETDSTRPEPQFSGFESQSDYTLTGSWTRAIGPRTSNTLRVQAVPQNTFLVHPPAPVGSEIDLGTVQLGTPFSYPYDAHWKRFQFDDNLSHVMGSHNLKFGGSWRPDYYSLRQEVWPHGQWQFSDGAYSILSIVGIAQGEAAAGALAAFNISRGYPAAGPSSTNLTAVQSYLAGAPTILFQAAENSNPLWQTWAQDVGFYAQDSWKVSRRLNVNYGVRIDYYHDPAPVPPSTQFSPRFGIAWSPGAKQKTVIRAGGGRFVAPTPFIVPVYTNLLGGDGKHINQNALVPGLPSPPFPSIFAAWALQASLATPAFPNPGLNTAQLASIGAVILPPGPGAFGNLIFTQGPNFKPAYSIQASFSVTREIAPNLSLDLAYLMYRSVHVDKSVEVNFVRDPSIPVDPFVGPMYVPKPGTTNGQPNAFIFQNNASSSIGTGTYHGGTASLSRRFKRSLQFQANYTFSRAIDDTSDYSSLSSPFRPDAQRLERALSSFNISHNFVANAVYAVPSHAGGGAAGWLRRDLTISPIVYARSGVPFTLLVPGLSNGTVGHNANARPWYASRNSGIGARFVSWDMRVSKMLFGKEGGTKLDFIAQGQNLLNRTNFAVVNANFPADPNYPLPGGGTLGKGPYSVHAFAPKAVSELSTPLAYTSAYPARQISLALKLAF